MGHLPEILKLQMLSDPSHLTDVRYPLYIKSILPFGITSFQLRAPDIDDISLLGAGLRLKPVLARAGVPLFVNNRPDIAQTLGAEGVHLGSTDIPISAVKRHFPDLLVGATVHSEEEAFSAKSEGADFLSLGAIFPSSTKPSVEVMSISLATSIIRTIHHPCMLIGGITLENLYEIMPTGWIGVAVCAALHPKEATEDFGLLTARISKISNRLIRLLGN